MKDNFFVGRKGDSRFRAFLQGQVLIGKAHTASYSSKFLGFAAVVKQKDGRQETSSRLWGSVHAIDAGALCWP